MALDTPRPDPKRVSDGGISKPKPRRNGASRERIAEIRAKKATSCRVCPNPDGYAIHAHHLVYGRRYGARAILWTENNIVGLCAACHEALHKGDARVKKILRARLTVAEVRYTDERAYEGYVDDRYWRIRPQVTSEDAA